mmetsp:Transcript_11775/g.25250  ORF Transcript_11775/g.25250 Transcript_11775/m.25250 type:complete len:303 (+) Transcript_11775:438-1346(+)
MPLPAPLPTVTKILTVPWTAQVSLRYLLAAALSNARGCPFSMSLMSPICTPRSFWSNWMPEYPAAAAMRPQLGSWPKMALFARLDPATLRATTRASSSLLAPVTEISTRHVAPSPSQAMDLARPCSSAVSAASSFWPSALAASVMVALPAAPLARPMTQSLVLVSPSTVIWLKEAMEARLTIAFHASALTAASHVTTESMVAMLGWIIPEPLHMPPMCTVLPPMFTCRAALLLTRSVVVMATAARCPSSSLVPRVPTISGMAGMKFSIFMRRPITPVDCSSTSSGVMLRALARALAVSTASA